MREELYWIWFSNLFGYGTRRCHEVLQAVEHPGALFEAREQELRMGGLLRPKELQQVLQHDLSVAEQQLRRADELGYTVLTPQHPEYPKKLQEIYGKPLALYVWGSLGGLEEQLCIGMVGTRKMGDYGSRMAAKLSYELASAGTAVVSGMAVGIDQVCHKSAIKAEGTTVGVLGCGIDIDYPKGAAPIKKLTAQNGAVISEYPPGTLPVAGRFPQRNRILSGLCDGVVVVEANEHSGSLITAGHALSQGRDVFVVPGRVDEPGSQGINKLLRQGAIPVTCAADILEEYPQRTAYRQQGAPEQPQKAAGTAPAVPILTTKRALPDYMNPTHCAIYELLSGQPISADIIAARLELPIAQVLSALTELEIYGYAKAQGGRSFVAV